MKTNKNCPLYGKRKAEKGAGDPQIMGAAEDTATDSLPAPSGELTAVEGTKLKISKKIYQHGDQRKDADSQLNVSKKKEEREEEEEERDEDIGESGDDADDDADADEFLMRREVSF